MSPEIRLSDANFLAHISVKDKEDLLKTLCRCAAELPRVTAAELDYDTIAKAIFDREELSTTALGSGVALPHARLPQLQELIVLIATLKNPIPSDAPDGVPMTIAALLLIPGGKPMEGLKFMARFANFVQMEELRAELEAATTGSELRQKLAHLNEESGKALVAGDIMKESTECLTPGLPLKEATIRMAQLRQPILPVVDGGKLVGEIACSRLFTLGIPDFFAQLKSVGFIRFFDPFEKYFSVESKSTVGEVMDKDCCVFYQDATLIEIVFAISILKHQQVYVVDQEQKLLGVIDQTLLLERIINL